MSILTRFQNAWNAFTNRNQIPKNTYGYSEGGSNPSQLRVNVRNERSMLVSVMNRIAVDASSISIRHVMLDENDRYLADKKSGLNNCLKYSANIDQTGTDFLRDVVLSMLDEGYVAIVPIDTSDDPKINDSYDIFSMRTGKIEEWYPDSVRVSVYNDRKGRKESIIMPKKCVAIIENPFYSVMNQPNSTMQRLIRKLRLLDNADETAYSTRLDLLLQLPYTVRTETKRAQAKERIKELENDLRSSELGIAFTDVTEKPIPLNRPLENQLLPQIKDLREQLLSELCITKEIMDGTATPDTMNNYYSRTIDPILVAIVEEMRRKFLTKTALSQGQSILYFRDILRLLPLSELGKFGDTMKRNEILSSNELRQIIGLKPSENPMADMLTNPNMPMQDEGAPMMPPEGMDPNMELPPEGY